MMRPNDTRTKVKRVIRHAELPPKIRRQLETYLERAPRGLEAYPDLLSHAHASGYYHTEPLSSATIESVRRHIFAVLSRVGVVGVTGVEDLLELKVTTINRGGREFITLSNPHMDRYRESEIAASRPGFKRPGYDSTSFVRAVSAVCAVARFNGEFYLAAEFRKHYKLHLDLMSRWERKSR